MTGTIGWSNFARGRHTQNSGYSYFEGSDEELEQCIRDAWESRVAGHGTDDPDKVSVVSLDPKGFRCGTVHVDRAFDLEASIDQRREGEDSHVVVRADGLCEEARFASIVLYSKEELIATGEDRSGDFDWEIVCIIASQVEDEPMHPLTMARNQLNKEGGSPRHYSSEEWADSVWYWSQRVKAKEVSL